MQKSSRMKSFQGRVIKILKIIRVATVVISLFSTTHNPLYVNSQADNINCLKKMESEKWHFNSAMKYNEKLILYIHFFIFIFSRYITNQIKWPVPSWLAMVIALHLYPKGHGLTPDLSLNFFRLSFYSCIKLYPSLHLLCIYNFFPF